MADGANYGAQVMKFKRWIWFVSAVIGITSLAVVLIGGCSQKSHSKRADFARSNTASVALGKPDREHGNGLEHVYWEQDGLTTVTNLDGVFCRHLQLEGAEIGYVYFIIDPEFKRHHIQRVKIEVEYFDGHRGEMGLQFDASHSRRVGSSAYTESGQIVPLRGSQRWQTSQFYVQDATFRNSENSRSDFRFWVRPPDLYLRSVTVTRSVK